MNYEKLNKNLTEAVKLKLRLCLLNLINDLTLRDEPVTVPFCLTHLNIKLLRLIPDFADSLKSSEADRSSLETALNDLRNEVLKAALPVFSAMNASTCGSDILEREYKNKRILELENDDYKDIEPHDAVEIFHNFCHRLNEDETGYACEFIMGNFPCRLTKGKFADYVTDFFLNSKECKNALDGEVMKNYLILTALPFAAYDAYDAYDYRGLFPEAGRLTDEIIKTDFRNLSADDIIDKIDEHMKLAEELYFSSDLCSMLFSDINYMTALINFGFDIDFVTDGDIVLKDLFYSAAELAEKGKPDEIDKELAERTNESSEDYICDISDKCRKLERDIDSYIEKLTEADLENSKLSTVYSVYKTVNRLYGFEVEEALYTCGLNIPELEESPYNPKKNAADFMTAFEKATEGFAPYAKKAARLSVINHIKCPYSLHEVLDYAKSALENSIGKPEYTLLMTLLGEIMHNLKNDDDLDDFDDDFDDFDDLDDLDDFDDFEEHHHHHDHDCGCGHHHH